MYFYGIFWLVVNNELSIQKSCLIYIIYKFDIYYSQSWKRCVTEFQKYIEREFTYWPRFGEGENLLLQLAGKIELVFPEYNEINHSQRI